MKRVVDIEYVGGCRYTGYVDKTAKLILECGHTEYRKASVPVPIKVKCKKCIAAMQNKG